MSDIPQEAVRLASKPANRILASEIASSKTDPRFYSALAVLPNPDPVLRKLGMADQVYDAIGYDAHVMGELRSLRGKVLKNKWRVMPGGDSPQDMQAFELMQRIFDRSPHQNGSWSDIIWNTFSAVFKGFAVGEVIWKKEGSLFIPTLVKDKPTRRFKFDHDRQLRVLTRDNSYLGQVVPNLKFVIARHMPNDDNPYGIALFSALFWPYTFKHNGYRWFSKFVERYGIPSPIGKYESGTSIDEQYKIMDNLAKMVEDAVAVVPKETEVDLMNAPAGAHVPHLELINLCNREMSKALTSQTLGSEVTEAGSRATAAVQENRQDDNAESDLEMVERAMQCICDWTTQVNFGPTVKAPSWEFYNEAKASKETAETLKLAVETAPILASEYYKHMQLTQPKDGDQVIFKGSGASNDAASFHTHRCSHEFADDESNELDDLADQAASMASGDVQKMVETIFDIAESASDLDDLDDSLSNALSKSDTKRFESALGDATAIGNLAGRDEVDD